MAQPQHHRTGAATGGRTDTRGLRRESGAPYSAPAASLDHGGGVPRARVEEAVREIAADVAFAAGDAFLSSLAIRLAEALGVSHVVVAERAAPDEDALHVVAMAGRGPESVALGDGKTASGSVLDKGALTLPVGARRKFPDDEMLRRLGAESFCARRLADAEGVALGLVALAHGEPLADATFAEMLIGRFAPRIAAELERRRAQRRSRENERRLRSLVENAPLAIVEIDRHGRVASANAEGARIAGRDCAAELVGEDVVELVAPWERGRVQDLVVQALRGRVCRFEYSSIVDEKTRVHSARLVPCRGDDGRIERLLGYAQDITARKSSEQKLVYRAEHDSLTGLPNHWLFMDRLRSGIARARRNDRRLALLFVDLNQFKPVNDEYGHRMGDHLLRGVARRLSATVREADTVARIGGDEFAVILEAISGAEDAALVAAKIAQRINEPFCIGGHVLHIDASIGIAVYPEHGEEAGDLLHRADAEMYRAKRSRAELRGA